MRGIVFLGDGKVEVTKDLDVRAPGPSEVIIRSVAAGVCHSDVSVINGTIPWPAPSCLGHEGAGIVDEIGSEVTTVAPGDHVVVSTLANCGVCKYCNDGHPTWCRKSIGNASQPFTLNGDPCTNFAATSSFAERTVVQAVQAVKIPDDVPLTSACLIACGVLTGVGAVLNRARVRPGETAAVFGTGGVGLNVIQGLRIAGATRIIAIDMLASKEPLAMQFGATDFIDASKVDAVEAIRSLLPGATQIFGDGGVDWAFECIGNANVLNSCMESLTWGGTTVAVGVPAPTAKLEARITNMTQVDRGVIGTRYGSSRPVHDIPVLVDLYKQGKLLLDELVTETYPLEGFDQVVHDMEEGKLARGVLTF